MKIEHKGETFDCYLGDDGTMDTVIEVNGVRVRFDCEYAARFRDGRGQVTEEGFKELAVEAIESVGEDDR
jgi:hypothetical protein